MATYKCWWLGQSIEVEADTPRHARRKAVKHLNARKGSEHSITVILVSCENPEKEDLDDSAQPRPLKPKSQGRHEKEKPRA